MLTDKKGALLGRFMCNFFLWIYLACNSFVVLTFSAASKQKYWLVQTIGHVVKALYYMTNQLLHLCECFDWKTKSSDMGHVWAFSLTKRNQCGIRGIMFQVLQFSQSQDNNHPSTWHRQKFAFSISCRFFCNIVIISKKCWVLTKPRNLSRSAQDRGSFPLLCQSQMSTPRF